MKNKLSGKQYFIARGRWLRPYGNVGLKELYRLAVRHNWPEWAFNAAREGYWSISS